MKKFMSIILSLAALLAIMPCAFAAETISADSKFIDVPADAWYLDDLNYAIANGYIAGTGDNTFSPDGVLTRGQFVTILGRMLGVSTTDGTTKFEDVPTASYYAPYVGWASKQGYVNGITDTMFYPDSYLTVEQMGTIFSNYISKTGVVLTDYTPSTGYKDAASISLWAQSSMETMKQYGLLVTDTDGRVSPTSQVTRANGAVSLVRLARGMRIGEEPTIKNPVPQTPTQQTGVVPQLGTSIGSIIPGDYQLIRRHEVDDLAAVENNIRYMLKYGVTEIELEVEDLKVPADFQPLEASNLEFGMLDMQADTALMDRYGYMLAQYIEFGYNSLRIDMHQRGGERAKDSISILIYNSSYRNPETIAKYQDSAFAAAKKVHDDMWSSGKITSSMTQKEKARVYYDWVLANCVGDTVSSNNFAQGKYSETNAESWLAYGVFANGMAVCEGYTSAYNLLLRMEGISCGSESSLKGQHAWSTATLDGVLYHIDATWGDQGASAANKYFCMTENAAWERFGGKPTGEWWNDWEIGGWW